MGRYELSIGPLLINDRWIYRIVVDDHVKKHPEITNEIIKELVKGLAWEKFESTKQATPYTYFAELRMFENKQYRVVWLVEDNQDFIGILTVFRDKKVR